MIETIIIIIVGVLICIGGLWAMNTLNGGE